MMYRNIQGVTILILIDGFLQLRIAMLKKHLVHVTILILIDGFLQCFNSNGDILDNKSHNPYFNRWFSAMQKK